MAFAGRKVLEQTGLELANLNNFSGLWGTGAILGCPILGLGAIRVGILWPRVCESLIRELVSGMDLISYSG